MESNIFKVLKDIEALGFNDVVKDSKASIYLDFLDKKGISVSSLSVGSFILEWQECHNETLSSETARKRLKLLIGSSNKFSIRYVEELQVINTFHTKICVLSSFRNDLKTFWIAFQNLILNSDIAPYGLKVGHFSFNRNKSLDDMLLALSELDESNKNDRVSKKLILLFFLYLATKNVALLSTSFIYSSDTFFERVLGLKTLEFFQKNSFFVVMPINKHLIENELGKNQKAKYINYLRFSYLVNQSVKLLPNVQNEHISRIMFNLRSSSKSSKMVDVNENSIRRCLYWHGATNIALSRAEAEKMILSPLELLASLEGINKNLLDVFARYFSSKPNNEEQRKFSRRIAELLIFMDETFAEISKSRLTEFFKTTVVKKGDNSAEIDSEFLRYLARSNMALTTQQDIQLIVFQAVENDNEFAGSFPKNNLRVIYKQPRNRMIARLAFDKRILEHMKRICLMDPPSDGYYVPTKLSKKNMLWKHFEKVEPQLPVMLFVHLSMPWRTEHVVSLDRNSFLVKNENKDVIAWKITTDKNQDNNFIIEREFIDYVFRFEDEHSNLYDCMALLDEIIEYAKKSFPNLQPLLRKENENWGPISPILCRNTARGFIPNGAYGGYYYKVLLKALFELGYKTEQIQYFVQLSGFGKEKLGDFPESYDAIEKLSINQVNAYFNSDFFSPHALRKSNITHFVQERKTFEFILKLSGHSALSTVLRVYIDYDMLAKLNISDSAKEIIAKSIWSDTTRISAKRIIENFQKYHTLESRLIIAKLASENLFFSPVILSKNNNALTKNQTDTLKILNPIFWEDLSTGICTNALNCPPFLEHRCSICSYFLTGPMFFMAINAKVMQLSTKVTEYFKIIDKHVQCENLNGKEAEIYEEETQIILAELQGYTAILDRLNRMLFNIAEENLSNSEKLTLPVEKDFVLLKYNHVPYYAAQLEIYKASKINMDDNKEIQFSISELYKKIMELILLEEIPRDLFLANSLDPEKTIDAFIDLLENRTIALDDVKRQFLIEYNTNV